MEQIKEVLGSSADDRPVHVHIAEQQKEVDDCLALSALRPIEWLYDNVAVDGRWCLIHATHAEANEVTAMVKSGAVANAVRPPRPISATDCFRPWTSRLRVAGLGSGPTVTSR